MTKTPSFCPNRDCPGHQETNANRGWFRKDGTYSCELSGKVQRYVCKLCGKRFSAKSFSLSYYLKKNGHFKYVFNKVKGCAGIRDIGRDIEMSPASVLLRLTRLARQSLSVNASLRDKIVLNEDLAADGFESFAVSQYFPNNIHVLAGKESQYIYGFDYAHLRRKGRMSDKQKIKNFGLQSRFLFPTSVSASFHDLCHTLSDLTRNGGRPAFTLYTDKKKEYAAVLKNYPFPVKINHIAVSGKLPRTRHNDLFSVNYLDREFRKDCAEHVRETTRFARNVNNCMERMAIYRLYHNYIKPYRINREAGVLKDRTHASVAGLPAWAVKKELSGFFTERRFLARGQGIGKEEAFTWLRCWITPLKQGYEDVPIYAAA